MATNKASPEPDYFRLQGILAAYYGRPVTLDEATATGKHLINAYDALIFDQERCDTITPDTTYR